MLIQYKSAVTSAGGKSKIEPDLKEILKFVKKSQPLDFPEFSPSEIGLITDIEIG